MAEQNPETRNTTPELTLLSSDMDLAVAAIDRHIGAAAEERLSDEEVELLKLQRILAGTILSNQEEGFDPTKMHEAQNARSEYIQRTGNGNDDTTNSEIVRMKFADEARWKIAEVDPTQNKDGPVKPSHVEDFWRQAAKAEQTRLVAEREVRQKETWATNELRKFRNRRGA